jgi:hypothetical protein
MCWVMIQILSPKRKADFWRSEAEAEVAHRATPFSQVAAGGGAAGGGAAAPPGGTVRVINTC